MQMTFIPSRRLAVLAILILVLPWLAGCGSRNPATLIEPPPGRPTFVWFFSDP